MDKENPKSCPLIKENGPLKKVHVKFGAPSAGSRDPLREICPNKFQANQASNNIKVRKSSYRVLKVKKSEVYVRSKSSSTAETKINYYLESRNITEHQSNGDIISNEDEVFVEGENHYFKYFPESKDVDHSSTKPQPKVEMKIAQQLPVQIKITLPSRENTEVEKPRRKITVVRRRNSRHRSCTEEDFYKDCLYDNDYFGENYKYMLEREKSFVLRKDLLKKVSDVKYRMIVVNWLINVQRVLRLTETTLFTGIRMFDYVILSTNIAANRYSLMGVTCLWIANKNFDVHFIQIPKLISLCSGKFTRQQFLSAEKEVLTALKFETNFEEPLSFLFYYLHREKLENNLKVRYSAMFLLEVFSLLLDFSSSKPSILACISLYLVLTKYDLETSSFLNYVGGHLIVSDMFLHKSNQMEYSVKELLMCKAVTEEVVKKYSTAEKCFVAKNFVRD